jgi:hypothetical protein
VAVKAPASATATENHAQVCAHLTGSKIHRREVGLTLRDHTLADLER